MAVYNFRHCTLPEKPVLFTISNLVPNCGKLSYISWYITTFLVVFELVFYQTKIGTYFPLCMYMYINLADFSICNYVIDTSYEMSYWQKFPNDFFSQFTLQLLGHASLGTLHFACFTYFTNSQMIFSTFHNVL